MQTELTNIFKLNSDLTDQEIEEATAHFKLLILGNGDDFLKEGKNSTRIGFVTQGIFRIFVSDNSGNEVIKYFAKENQFVTDLESFNYNKPATDNIQAITYCELMVISKTELETLKIKIPKFQFAMKAISEMALLNKIKDQSFLRLGSATEKYQEFIKHHADIALRVPLQYIAAYLGVTPQSLSRIRRQQF